MDEKVSIVLTSYNYADYIRESIESVLSQTYSNWELIVVDDASSDNSVEVINEYAQKDSRIKLFVNETNKGLASSLKFGIEQADSEWIAFLESDDKFTPDSIYEKMRAIKENPSIDILFTALQMFQDEKKIKEMGNYFRDIEEMFVKLDSSKFIENFNKIIPKLNIIPTFSVVIAKKKLFESCNFYPPCKASVDYYLWAQLSHCNFYYLNKVLTYWRIHNQSYLNVDKHSWFTRFIFFAQVYYFTIRNKNLILRFLLMLNYLRTRFIYLKFDKKSIKLNLLNNKFIFEKFWK